MKVLVLILVIFILNISSIDYAQAHVFIESENKSSSSIVHITPDDDPIAGEISVIYFDIRSDVMSNDITDYYLSIFQEKLGKDKVEVNKVGEFGVRAEYVFPFQGVYTLELSSENESEDKFIFTQRVSRGVIGVNTTEKLDHKWADAGLIIGIILIVVILIILINRRKKIFN